MSYRRRAASPDRRSSAKRPVDGGGEVLEVTTSGHRTGSWDLSVTYAAVAFRGSWTGWKEPEPARPLGQLTPAQGAEAVALARAALESHLVHDGSLAEWYAASKEREALRSKAGAFVTLNHKGFKAGDSGRLRASTAASMTIRSPT